MLKVIFKPSNVHQGYYVYINDIPTGIVVNMHAYNTIPEYRQDVDSKINNEIKEYNYENRCK